MGNGCLLMGLTFRFIVAPAPLDVADEGLPAFVIFYFYLNFLFLSKLMSPDPNDLLD